MVCEGGADGAELYRFEGFSVGKELACRGLLQALPGGDMLARLRSSLASTR